MHSLDPNDDEAANGRRLGGCCTHSCKLKPGALCSPSNHQCCDQQCAIVPKNRSVECLPADLQYCFAAAYCDGTLDGCPAKKLLHQEEEGEGEEGRWRRPKLADGAPCLNGGTCQGGYCNSSCPAGSADCQCPQWAANGCKVCCQAVLKNGSEVTRGECRPEAEVHRPEGTHCLFNETERGFCTADGWCRLPKRDELSEGTVFPVTVSPLSDGDEDDFDGEDLWALMKG